jgi:hypothetical protein
MKQLLCLILLVIWLVPCPADPPDKVDDSLTKKIELIINQTATIKPGQTRKDLLKIFTTESGLSDRNFRTYVYRSCPYIKVDVHFEEVGNPAGPLNENDDDKIVSI